MPMVAPCRVMAIGVFDSRKLDRFSRNSRIPTLVACMVFPRWVHNDNTTLEVPPALRAAARVPNGSGGTRPGVAFSRGANPGTDSQFPANCAGNLVSVPGLRRIATHLQNG